MSNKRYQIWDKQSNVYTPVGEEMTPSQWISRYSWINNPAAVPVVAAGLINGGFCGELSQMKTMAENDGATFADALSSEELLDAIVEYYDNKEKAASEEVSTEERTAAALEMIAVQGMPDATTTE